jgi:4-hydroxybenzoate polyprenyltransferase
MIKEYLKLARSFNSFLTGISPVMGAIAMSDFNLYHLVILFLIGFFGHTYGFVLNDICDYEIDKKNKELGDRPLISGTITIKKAWIFTIFSLIIAILLALYYSYITNKYFPLLILIFSACLITIYDSISKKWPLMDIFNSLAVFTFILYGATTVSGNIANISNLAWLVCILGSIQVFFMQLVPGGLKDIENDFKTGANTVAVKLGVRITNNDILKIPLSYKILSYGIQIFNISLVFLPFFYLIFISRETIHYIIWSLLGLVTILMFLITHLFLNMKYFERGEMRRLLGVHFFVNFSLVPIMLMALNPWTILIVIFPPIGFIASNLVLHGTFLQPKTM